MKAPIPIVVTRYKCPYCNQSRSKVKATADHIERCWKNPEARGCKTCDNYEPPTPGPYEGHPGWPESCYEGKDLTESLHVNCPLWADSAQGCAR